MGKRSKKQPEAAAPEAGEVKATGPIAEAKEAQAEAKEAAAAAEEPEPRFDPLPAATVLVNLKKDVYINGVKYPAGDNVEMPADSFHAYRHAL